MNVRTVGARLAQGDFQYILGRFKTVRVSYSAVRHLFEISRSGQRDDVPRSSLFPEVDVELAVRAIRQEAVFIGLRRSRRRAPLRKSTSSADPSRSIHASIP